MFRIAHRKLVSLFVRITIILRAFFVKVRILLSGKSVKIGANLNIGSHVELITTDGGSIVIGDNVTIERMVFLGAKGGQLLIDSDTFIGQGSQIVATERIEIGRRCLIAAYCAIHDSKHIINPISLSNASAKASASITIGDRTWLGTHVVVTHGVQVGEGCIIGANAVVTASITPDSLAVGVPAKRIRRL